VVKPFGHADEAEAHAETHEPADGRHEVGVADLVLLDNTSVIWLLMSMLYFFFLRPRFYANKIFSD
jgi:hypothetical protein